MNSTITFTDSGLFSLAATALEMEATPSYRLNGLSIETDDVEGIAAILNDNGIFSFDVASDELTDEEKDMHDDHDYNDDMDGDFDSGMASAGFGTDEDYGCYGGGEE